MRKAYIFVSFSARGGHWISFCPGAMEMIISQTMPIKHTSHFLIRLMRDWSERREKRRILQMKDRQKIVSFFLYGEHWKNALSVWYGHFRCTVLIVRVYCIFQKGERHVLLTVDNGERPFLSCLSRISCCNSTAQMLYTKQTLWRTMWARHEARHVFWRLLVPHVNLHALPDRYAFYSRCTNYHAKCILCDLITASEITVTLHVVSWDLGKTRVFSLYFCVLLHVDLI